MGSLVTGRRSGMACTDVDGKFATATLTNCREEVGRKWGGGSFAELFPSAKTTMPRLQDQD